jgi:hypothetical protein
MNPASALWSVRNVQTCPVFGGSTRKTLFDVGQYPFDYARCRMSLAILWRLHTIY